MDNLKKDAEKAFKQKIIDAYKQSRLTENDRWHIEQNAKRMAARFESKR